MDPATRDWSDRDSATMCELHHEMNQFASRPDPAIMALCLVHELVSAIEPIIGKQAVADILLRAQERSGCPPQKPSLRLI